MAQVAVLKANEAAEQDRVNATRRAQLEKLAAKISQDQELLKERDNELSTKKRELDSMLEELSRDMAKHEREIIERFSAKEKQMDAEIIKLKKQEIELGNMKRDMLREIEDRKRALDNDFNVSKLGMQNYAELEAAKRETENREAALTATLQALQQELQVVKSAKAKREEESNISHKETEASILEIAKREHILEITHARMYQ